MPPLLVPSPTLRCEPILDPHPTGPPGTCLSLPIPTSRFVPVPSCPTSLACPAQFPPDEPHLAASSRPDFPVRPAPVSTARPGPALSDPDNPTLPNSPQFDCPHATDLANAIPFRHACPGLFDPAPTHLADPLRYRSSSPRLSRPSRAISDTPSRTKPFRLDLPDRASPGHFD